MFSLDRTKKIVWLLILLYSFTLPLSIVSAATTDEIPLETFIADVERIVSDHMKDSDVPGLQVVVVKGREVIYNKGFGYADVHAKPVTSETLFELGSVSKAYTAVAVLKARDGGLLRLDDPVAQYLPWLRMTYKGQETDITLRQLLHHTAGIPADLLGEIPVVAGDHALERTVRMLAGKELVYKPGDRFVYSTINYDVLGLVLQAVTGKPFAEYVRQEVLLPLGLLHTYVGREEVPAEQLAAGHKWWFGSARPYQSPYYGGNVPAGYIITNGVDMGRWLQVQLGTADVDPQLVKLVQETQQANRTVMPYGDGSSYAMGWNVLQQGGGQLFHDGSNPNYFSSVVLRPQEQVGVAVLANINGYLPQKIANDIVDRFTGREEPFSYTDNYARLDNIGSLLLIGSITFSGLMVYLTILLFIDLARKKRELAAIKPKGLAGMFALLLASALFYGCLYLVPKAFLNGYSWSTLAVYAPSTFYLSMISLAAAGALFLVYFTCNVLFPAPGKISYVSLAVLSLLSGFGNALIVFTVNTVVSGRARIGFDRADQTANYLLLYFILGIVLYVVGQRVLRPILIQLTNDLMYMKRTELISKIVGTSYEDLEKIKHERLQSTLNHDTEEISNIVNLVVSGLTSLITLLFCFIYLGLLNMMGLLISFVVIVLAAGMYYFVGSRANRLWEQTRDIQNVFIMKINDLFQGFKELALSRSKRSDFENDFRASCEDYRVKRVQGAVSFAMVFIVGELLFVIVLGIIGFLFPLWFDNAFSFVRDYVFVFIYMAGPINILLSSLPQLTMVKISWKRINELNDTLHVVSQRTSENTVYAMEGNLELTVDQVEFEYESEDGSKFAVGPLSTVFRSGEIVFVTGGNGSGKSTFAKLLSGLYRPSQGRLLLNGIPVEAKELNENFTAIFSDFHLFKKLYGIDYRQKEDVIRRCLKLLHLEEKVRIDDGIISSTQLSTGQKKRLALLVSYLDDRPFYLFDEWAADQDPEYRKFFYHELLPQLKHQGKCIIAITHDDMYFHLADRFIKLDFGKIVIDDIASMQAAVASEHG